MEIQFKYNDGGRSQYYKAQGVRDCVTRAFAIATGQDYKAIYELARKYEGGTPRNGVTKSTTRKVAKALGGTWHATMAIGQGCHTHLKAGEIPMEGRIVCQLSGHVTAVVDGVLQDTYDCTRGGTRCVYGYWTFD